jgi:hypothetical protein
MQSVPAKLNNLTQTSDAAGMSSVGFFYGIVKKKIEREQLWIQPILIFKLILL